METVTISGWREGLNKIALNHLLRQHAGWGPGDAKRAVDQLLTGEPLTFVFPDGESASAFRRSVSAVGAVCSAVVDGSGRAAGDEPGRVRRF